ALVCTPDCLRKLRGHREKCPPNRYRCAVPGNIDSARGRAFAQTLSAYPVFDDANSSTSVSTTLFSAGGVSAALSQLSRAMSRRTSFGTAFVSAASALAGIASLSIGSLISVRVFDLNQCAVLVSWRFLANSSVGVGVLKGGHRP